MDGKVIAFPRAPKGPPPFDPSNPAHVAAWTAMWEAGQELLRRQREIEQ